MHVNLCMPKSTKQSKPIWVVAGFLAWLVPGAGHVYIGRPRRGLILFVTIAATFWAGIAMGGVMTVDYRYQRWWFSAQMLCGVHGLVGWYQQEQVYRKLGKDPRMTRVHPAANGRPDNQQMLVDYELKQDGIVFTYPTEGVARAYSGVAGMLNLLCIFDALMLALAGGSRKPLEAQKVYKQGSKKS